MVILILELKEEEFQFNKERNILITFRHYNNGKFYCKMQLTLINAVAYGQDMYFNVTIDIWETLPNNRYGKNLGRQLSFFH